MNIKEVISSDKVDFTGIELSYFLLGLLSAFENRLALHWEGTGKALMSEFIRSHGRSLSPD